MSKIRNTIIWILLLPSLALIALFIIAGINNGFDEAVKMVFSVPRNLFCSATGLCGVDDDTEVIEEDVIWTRIYERALLDVGKFEQRGSWRATRTTFVVTHSMRMQATINVTMALNLSTIQPEDILVDDEAQTVTITIPPPQPSECFLTDIVYSDASCLGVCSDLESDLVERAARDYYSEDVEIALGNAYEQGKQVLSTLIDPLIEDYELVFVRSEEALPSIPGSTCP